jgi:hypothetical protein
VYLEAGRERGLANGARDAGDPVGASRFQAAIEALRPEKRGSMAPAPRLLCSMTMKTRALLVRGFCLLALAGLAAASAGCEDRVVVRRPAPAVRVYSPPVVEERVIIH